MRAACGTYAAPVAIPTTDTAHARKESTPPGLSMALPAVSEEPEHHQEEVDEVEIEGERAGDRAAPAFLGTALHRERHHLEPARVVGREADEDDDTHAAHHEAEHVGPQEEVDDGRDDHPDEAHEGEGAEAVESPVRRETVDAHRGERPRRDEKRRGDRPRREREEDDRERHAIQGGIEEKNARGCGGRELPNEAGQPDDEPELREQEAVEHELVSEDSAEDGLVRDGEKRRA